MESVRETDDLSYPSSDSECLLRVRQALLIASAWPLDADALTSASGLLLKARRFLLEHAA